MLFFFFFSSYKHAIDGLFRVFREGKYQIGYTIASCLALTGITCDFWFLSCHAEGIRKLFSGASMASSRGAMVTVGQASYGSTNVLAGYNFLSGNIVFFF